ncbi:MAG: T9SS type A sorting domain-containing protein [Melioribacteraceae bacterium]|nr:T9SS type A sorting domain-containing protein [Melioribacteraceae bacterium]MCF8353359.1 T9SS type A sorting domain-containing protein [Melioribacteraceae bacterium]MCF8393223.1 T9SS type A sorting domain-containing protein [Melioribacteraceae bacterium]MCF8419085.1 T9SS type A sorting domain-containing protein [Melioribacteraceae bacterium]
MQGRKTNGEPFINPNTNSETVFPLSGDPEGMRGWYDGMGTWGDFGTGGREYALSSGPFNLAPGDTQEVVYAIFMARGSNNLNSVTELKNKGEYIRQYYQDILANTQEDNELIINEYKLYQSYPNPFNPTTTIEFNIPAVVGTSPTTVGKRDLSLHTKIIVFDILGREVKTLINKPMQPGRHKVEFDASGLASGVYFYQLKAGDFIQTKKMVLLR